MMPTRANSGSLLKWTLTMYPHGAGAVGQMSKIVRCYASLTIGQKEIGKNIQAPQQSPAGDILKAAPGEWR